MAEVSLRLLRTKARQHLIEETVPWGRKHGGSLAPPCLALGESTGVAGLEASDRLRLYSLWPSGTARGRTARVTFARPMSTGQELRFYSQWAGSGNGPNGAQAVRSPLYKSRTAYYDILGVMGNATQSQIKTAYYKQSFRFHPDRNSGNEDAAQQFGLVTEAYHVLGSVTLRKKYDRGILSLEDVRSAKKPSGKSGSPSRKAAGGQREASSSSATPAKFMFNFDAFYQAHYGEQLAREQAWKARRAQLEKEKLEKKMSGQFNQLGELLAMLILVSGTALLLTLR